MTTRCVSNMADSAIHHAQWTADADCGAGAFRRPPTTTAPLQARGRAASELVFVVRGQERIIFINPTLICDHAAIRRRCKPGITI
ncbi:hypothetical protein EVAR_79737_1 [Eumeta japonica]|uniref:Uncharacterized protein n=1 Tax=Eumeta variegata TaxID=151549 RepID=A0A4C1TA95_EUMVA|nr:hypothetical protein EVAR_79737_1 [Eumeta japonica]